jgi:hypothetical protein
MQSVTGVPEWSVLAIACIVTYFVRVETIAERACATVGKSIVWGVTIALMSFSVVLCLDLSAVFIYFRF